MRAALWSVWAILAGLLAASATVLILTAGTVWLFFGGDVHAEPTPLYILFNLLYTFGAAFLGGWLTARIARSGALIHAGVLALGMVILTVVGGSGGDGMGVPMWYDAAITIVGSGGVLVGAVLVVLRPDRYEPVDLPA